MEYTIEMLRKRARHLRETLTTHPPERPIFVEFSGTPKSGKSTCIDIVSHFFQRLGFRTLAPTEGASKRTPYYLREDLTAYNGWSACYALTHVLEGLYHSDRFHIALLDRGLFDALVWFELLAIREQISPEVCSQVQKFLLIEKWRSVINAVFLFKADPNTSMERENRNKLVSDPGSVMNHSFLTELNNAYDQIHQRYSRVFPLFKLVDTSTSPDFNTPIVDD
jgi:hypothetical protein